MFVLLLAGGSAFGTGHVSARAVEMAGAESNQSVKDARDAVAQDGADGNDNQRHLDLSILHVPYATSVGGPSMGRSAPRPLLADRGLNG